MIRMVVNLQLAKTERNRDCPWSVGIMNATRDEAELIERFARSLEAKRDFPARPRDEPRYNRPPPVTVITGRTISQQPEPIEPEPEKPRNRFSGLDIT